MKQIKITDEVLIKYLTNNFLSEHNRDGRVVVNVRVVKHIFKTKEDRIEIIVDFGYDYIKLDFYIGNKKDFELCTIVKSFMCMAYSEDINCVISPGFLSVINDVNKACASNLETIKYYLIEWYENYKETK